MAPLGFFDDFDVATKLFVTGFDEEGIFFDGDDPVVDIADHAEEGNFCFGEGGEVIDGVEGVGAGLFVGHGVGFEDLLPVAAGEAGSTFATGPAFEVADWGIEVESGDAIGVTRGPIEGVEATATEAFEDGLGVEVEGLEDVVVKFVHGVEGDGSAEETTDIDIGDMEALAEEGDIGLGIDAEEFGTPDPRLVWGGSFGDDEEGGAALDFERRHFVPVPVGGVSGEKEEEGECEKEEGFEHRKEDEWMGRMGNCDGFAKRGVRSSGGRKCGGSGWRPCR